MNTPKYIILHHTAVSYTKNPNQFEATRRYHISLGWGDIGYHYEIAKDGTIHKGRDEKTVGAHCYQQGMNSQSIGIALDGNFDIELPTPQQEKALGQLLLEVAQRYTIPADRIQPHRLYATYKSCPGTKLANDWGANLLKKTMAGTVQRKQATISVEIQPDGSRRYLVQGVPGRADGTTTAAEILDKYGII